MRFIYAVVTIAGMLLADILPFAGISAACRECCAGQAVAKSCCRDEAMTDVCCPECVSAGPGTQANPPQIYGFSLRTGSRTPVEPADMPRSLEAEPHVILPFRAAIGPPDQCRISPHITTRVLRI